MTPIFADVCNVLTPDLVAVGGELAAAGAAFVDPLRQVVERYTQPMVMRSLVSASVGRPEKAR